MSDLKHAALAAVEAIERSDSIEYLQNVIVPALREALRVKAKFTIEQRKVLSMLKEGPRMFVDMCEDLPITKSAAQRAVTQLADRKLIHMKSFRIGGGPAYRVWAIGAPPAGHRASPAVVSRKRYPSDAIRAEKQNARRKELTEEKKKQDSFVPRRDAASAWI